MPDSPADRLPDTEEEQTELYVKDTRSAQIHGQVFEYKFCALAFLRAKNKGYKFKLASNMVGHGAFDDVFVEYLDDNSRKSHIFVQLKSKLRQRVTMEELLAAKGDFSLRKYYDSYIKIEEKFNCSKEGVKLEGSIDDSLFILYTNAGVAKNLQCNKVTDIGEVEFLKTSGSVLQFNEKEHPDIYYHMQKLPKYREFFSRFRIFYSQTDEKGMDSHIKYELQQIMNLPANELDITYTCFIDSIMDWWQNENFILKYTNSRENDPLWKTSEKLKPILEAKEGLRKYELEARRRNPIWFNMKEPVKLFTGRVDELGDLYKKLQNEGGQLVISQAAAVTGLGGIGKTELARKYAHEHIKNYDGNVIWIDSETQESLRWSFKELAKELNIPTTEEIDENIQERDVKSITKDVYKYFSGMKSLFIFDNAEGYKDIKEFVPNFLHPNDKKPYILITSRNQRWRDIEVMFLGTFTEKEAMDFIRKVLSIEDGSEENEIQKLAETLQCFPLALQQAVAFIKERDIALRNVGREYKISNYLETYGEETKKLLDFKFPEDSSDLYTKTTFTTWRVTTDKIAEDQEYGEQAMDILNIMAYFVPENISTRMFLGLVGNNEEKLGSAVQLLKQYSMVNLGQEQVLLNIHRLVQQVIRINLKDQNKEEEILRKALDLVNNSNITKKNINHVTSVWNYASEYVELSKSYFGSVYGENKSTPLHLLADSGNDTEIDNILKHISKRVIDCADMNGRTPLYRAAENGHIEVVELLVQRGANINVNSATAASFAATKWTVLHGAAHGGNEGVVKFLIDNGADINAKDSMGRDPLYVAINQGHEKIVKLLDKTGKSGFHIAASLGKLEVVEEILRDKSKQERIIITNPLEEGKRGPLHFAANNGHLKVVELLVNNGADINSSAKDGFTPLHMAASEGNQDIVKFLVEEAIKQSNGKFDILKNSNISGWTILHSAAKSGQTETLKYLINTFSKDKEGSVIKALINASDTKGTTLLQTAAFHGKLDTVKFLIDKKANINTVDIFGATPLFAAFILNHYEVVKYLLKKKETRIHCDLEKIIGMLDITPLHAAAAYDNLDMVKLLVEKKSRINAGEKSSLTPLHFAAFFGSSKVIEYLVDKGASTKTGINLSNIANVLNFAKGDLKGKYGLQVINHIIPPINFFLRILSVGNYIGSQLTPGMISAALKYNNQLAQKDANGQSIRSIVAKVISFALSYSPIEKQLQTLQKLRDNVQSKESGEPAPLISEDSKLAGIVHIKSSTKDNKKEQSSFSGKILKWILNLYHVNINAKDGDGNTALHSAVQEGNFELVKHLVSKKADPNIQDNNGKTPLDLAQERLAQDPENNNPKAITALLLSVTGESQH